MKKVIVSLGLFSTLSSFAQQNNTGTDSSIKSDDLQEVIIQGNRLQTPFNEATRDIQVITQKQIQALPAKSLNEVLSYISGVDIRQRGPFGTRESP